MSVKTPNFHLKKWESSDKPVMDDFNHLSEGIDNALASLSGNITALAENSEKMGADITTLSKNRMVVD